MVTKTQQQKMKDYLVTKLETCSLNIEPKTKEIVPGKQCSYILVEQSGIVLLIDQPFSKEDFAKLQHRAEAEYENIGIVFFKDGKTFFRSAEHRGHQRKKPTRSLKGYPKKKISKLIRLTQAEIQIANNRTFSQYYQPESPRLNEGLESFSFKAARLDYSHIENRQRFGPIRQDSKRLFFWEYRGHTTSDLVLQNNYLKDVSAAGE
jgi:hypothetical protein